MEFSASKALGDAVALMTSRIGSLLAVVAIYIVAAIVLFFVFGASMMAVFQQAIMGGSGSAMSPSEGGGFFAGVFLFYLLFYALQFFEQSALCRLCSDRHEPNVGEALAVGLRTVLPLFGVAILAFISMFVVMFVLGLLLAALGGAGGGGAGSTALSLVMLIGGIWLMSRLCVILPVVANDEERNPIRAIANAWAMTAGHALKIALLFVAVGVVMLIVFGGLFFAFIGTPEPGNMPNFGSLGLMMILFLVLGTLAGIYIVAMVTAIHNQLSPTGTDGIREAFA